MRNPGSRGFSLISMRFGFFAAAFAALVLSGAVGGILPAGGPDMALAQGAQSGSGAKDAHTAPAAAAQPVARAADVATPVETPTKSNLKHTSIFKHTLQNNFIIFT